MVGGDQIRWPRSSDAEIVPLSRRRPGAAVAIFEEMLVGIRTSRPVSGGPWKSHPDMARGMAARRSFSSIHEPGRWTCRTCRYGHLDVPVFVAASRLSICSITSGWSGRVSSTPIILGGERACRVGRRPAECVMGAGQRPACIVVTACRQHSAILTPTREPT